MDADRLASLEALFAKVRRDASLQALQMIRDGVPTSEVLAHLGRAAEQGARIVGDYAARLRVDGQRLVTATEAAEEVLMGVVTASTVRSWAKRGLIATTKDRRGRCLFRVHDLLRVEARTRRRAGRRRPAGTTGSADTAQPVGHLAHMAQDAPE